MNRNNQKGKERRKGHTPKGKERTTKEIKETEIKETGWKQLHANAVTGGSKQLTEWP